MPFIVANPETHAGLVVGNGHCVRFLQLAGGLPHTSTWRRGALVRESGAAPGTAIATFDPDGRYGNHVDGRSHTAVLVAIEEAGLSVWDQWVGQPVHQRLLRYRAGHGRAANDGNRFYVIEPA